MGLKKGLLWVALILVLLYSCTTDKEEFVPDVSNIAVDLSVRRFEKDLFALDTNQLAPGLAQLEANYPEFSRIYFNRILASKDSMVAPMGHVSYIRGFLTHPAVRHLYDTCMVLYDEMPRAEDFHKAFQYYKYYFPGREVPDLTTFISEFTIANFIYAENSLAIGLDFFLGANYPYARFDPTNPFFSSYLTRTFNREHMVRKTFTPLVEDLIGQPKGNRLLDIMIHNGKKLYILDKVLPFEPDSIIMEVSETQSQWLGYNELEMWAYFLKEDLLYSSDYQNIRKYVDYSPNSPGMPKEAPGRTANWIGWQIIKAYMDRYPETTMEDLIALRDAQDLMDRSRYKPGR